MFHQRFLVALISLLVIVASVRGQAAPAAPARGELEALAGRLLSPDPRTRDEAMARLVEIGPPALPVINEFLRNMDELERFLIDKQPPGFGAATVITLKLRNVPVETALKQLSTQLGSQITLPPSHPKTTISIDVKEQPFWPVLQEICASADLAVKSIEPGAIQLIPVAEGGIPIGAAHSAFHDGFLIVCLAAEFQQAKGRQPGATNGVTLKLALLVEPKLEAPRVCPPGFGLVVSNNGENLRVTPEYHQAIAAGEFRPVESISHHTVSFIAHNRTKSLQQVNGVIVVAPPGSAEVAEMLDPATAGQAKYVLAGRTITVADFKRLSPSSWGAMISCDPPVEVIRGGPPTVVITAQAARGTMIRVQGAIGSVRGDAAAPAQFHFYDPNPIQKVIITVPAPQRIVVPFAFKDIAIP